MKRTSTLAVILLAVVTTSQAFAEAPFPTQLQKADVLQQQQIDKEAAFEKNSRRPDAAIREQVVKDKKAKLSGKAAEISEKRHSSLDEAVRKKQEADTSRRQK